MSRIVLSSPRLALDDALRFLEVLGKDDRDADIVESGVDLDRSG